MRTVTSLEQIVANVQTFASYGQSAEPQVRERYAKLLKAGRKYVCVQLPTGLTFCPSRFAGYANNTLRKRAANDAKDGKETNPAISALIGGFAPSPQRERQLIKACMEFGVAPGAHRREYWKLIYADGASPELDDGFPDEVRGRHWEGASTRVSVNRYERDPKAREACLRHYGTACFVCGFDFGAYYGDERSGYIHVHHLVALATIKERYEVDPVADLRPVCPNCHAMLHFGGGLSSPEELRELIGKAAKQRRKKPGREFRY